MSDTEEDIVDFSAYAPVAEVGDIKILTDMVKRAGEIQAGLKKLDDRSKIGKNQLKSLLEEEIPAKMASCGFGKDDSITAGGFTVTIKDDVYCNVPSVSSINDERDADKRAILVDRRDKGLYLIEQEAPALIKRKYEVEFGKDEREEALEFEETIADLVDESRVTKGMSVHAQTLGKWFKEKLADGWCPTEEWKYAVGYFPKKVAKIK